MNNILNSMTDLNQSLKELSKCAKGFSDLVSIMTELNMGQSKQWEFFVEFNNFIWYLNQKYNTNFRTFYIEESICEAICYFNNIVDYINEKCNKQISHVTLGISWNEAFDILNLMKEVVGD